MKSVLIMLSTQNRRYWDQTDSGAYIVPSRTSILETLPRVVNSPMRLTPKSTIGVFENVIFQTRNFGTYHPWVSGVILLAAVVGLFYILRNGERVRRGLSSSRNSSGYFRLDGKEGGLLNGGGGGGNGKAD